MKKIMMAAAIVCAAVSSQAAVANWGATAANIYNGAGDASAKWAGTAYVFDASTITQAALYEMFASGTAFDSLSIASLTVNASGAITGTNGQFSYGEQSGGDYSFFFVLVEDDRIYLSKTVTAAANASATAKSLTFGSQLAGSKLTSEGFSTPGQWATAAVPEPTSGLLLLLGVAGLALKRKRA